MNKTLVVCAILVACVALNQAAKTKTRGYPDLKTTKTRNSGVVTRNGLFKWVSFNNVDAFNTNDDGSTWNWIQNGRIIMRFGLEKTEWETNSVLTIILKRKDVENFFVKLTPYEFSWGTTANEANNFYASGNWKEFGNSLNGNAGDSTDVDVVNKRVVPIPSRFLKEISVRQTGAFRWTSLSTFDVFNTNDDGSTWNWIQNGRIIMRLGLEKIAWEANSVLTIILKRKDVENFFVKLTPYEFSWGTTADGANNFYANGNWKEFGNSLNGNAGDSTDVTVVDRSTRSSVPIPSRILKQLTAPSVRNGVFKWKNLNADKEEFFNTNDDGTVWLWFQKGRNTIQLVNSKIEWITGGVLSIILKRKDVDNFFVKLTPTEAFWGTSADAITNFYANGAWEKFGNSLTEETTNTDDVDVVGKRKRSVPIPSRYLKSN